MVAAGDVPIGVAVSPDGRSVYVANEGTGEPGEDIPGVSQYDVGAGGKLSPKNPATLAVGLGHPRAVAVSPNGESVYLAGTPVHQYDVGAGGELSPKDPATVADCGGAFGVAVSPGARVPTREGQCKHGGWKQFGFKSQGRCIRFVKRGSRK